MSAPSFAITQREASPGRRVAGHRGAVSVLEAGCVRVLGLPDLEAIAELGIEGDASTADAAFVDSGALVLVVRAGDRAQLHVVDPTGPRVLGELALGAEARIAAVSGRFVLIVDGAAASVIDTAHAPLVAVPLAMRQPMTAAGALAAGRFLIATAAALEEWDGETRSPVRRLRLDRALHPAQLGGSADRIWIVARNASNFVELISLANRSARRIELPEPVVRVIAQPRGDLLAVVGESDCYVIDTARARPVLPLDCGSLDDVAWLDDHRLAVAATGEPLSIVELASPHRRMATAVAARVEPTVADLASPVRAAAPRAPRPGGWRAELVAWARGEPEATVPAPITELATRIAQPSAAIARLYAARLLGTDGLAPIELAEALGWRWDEALGGELGGWLRRRRGRCHLSEELAAELDDRLW